MAEVLVWGCNVADSWILLRMFLDSFQKVNGKNLALIPGRARLSCCIMPLPLPFVEHMTCWRNRVTCPLNCSRPIFSFPVPKSIEWELKCETQEGYIQRTWTYGYGSKPITINFSGMNIYLQAILGFTRYQGFDPSPYNCITLIFLHQSDFLDLQAVAAPGRCIEVWCVAACCWNWLGGSLAPNSSWDGSVSSSVELRCGWPYMCSYWLMTIPRCWCFLLRNISKLCAAMPSPTSSLFHKMKPLKALLEISNPIQPRLFIVLSFVAYSAAGLAALEPRRSLPGQLVQWLCTGWGSREALLQGPLKILGALLMLPFTASATCRVCGVCFVLLFFWDACENRGWVVELAILLFGHPCLLRSVLQVIAAQVWLRTISFIVWLAVACPCCRLQIADNVFDAFEQELAVPLLQCSFLAFACTLGGMVLVPCHGKNALLLNFDVENWDLNEYWWHLLISHPLGVQLWGFVSFAFAFGPFHPVQFRYHLSNYVLINGYQA